jgi:Zn-dependent protease
MLGLLTLPIQLVRVAFYALQGLVDALRSRNRLRTEFTVVVNASREAVWRLSTTDHLVLDGPPSMEISYKPLPDSDDLWLTCITVSGQPRVQAVSREIERDEVKGVARSKVVAHPLSIPAENGRDVESGLMIGTTADGTTLTLFNEFTVRSFKDRIIYPLAPRQMANLMKQQCERDAGTQSRLAALGNNGLLLSGVALLSFCYLFGWKPGLLLAIVVVLHEMGHVAAMLMAGVGVHSIYLIPFFGGAAVPKTAYRTEARLGFIALMGPGLSLIPTLGLFALYRTTGDIQIRDAAEMFAVVNAANLLPLYPLDGGLILNALIGSVSRQFALIVGWIGVLAGLGLGLYFHSFLIGVPFFLFALQRYLGGSQTIELERLSFGGGVVLALASIASFALYVFVITVLHARV